ncbi:3-deoxy-D-manno-octulosonic acid transferase [Porphyromonadaceae bacterium OttesenSCG-928-L07]|nr:3-deoxy-D-manno-octulosonic acid transferase [Porphyromonadaceae bacterium OttesenSCG-928-L07]MDL2330804.1 3-deoxy-D-manno-octulosonic acid transferase [Odoribacter sp. OttesenSCG-928-A06]
MKLLYNLGIILYTIGIHLAAPFNEKARLWVKGRKNIRKKIREIRKGDEKIAWFHAASLGEFEQGRPVIESLKEKHPDIRILLTFFSPSGYEVRKNYQGADHILYLPADRPGNARFFIKHIRPDLTVFIKYEFWYNYLNALHKKNIPTYLISAIFRKEQPFFKKWGSLHRKMLRFFNKIFVQDNESVQLLASIHIEKVEKTGDTRFDRVKQIADAAQDIEKVKLFCDGRTTIVCGSTWPPDEEILMEYINRSAREYKWIIAPHEIGSNHIKNIIDKCEKKVVRYSDETADLTQADVLIIDCIGLLSAIYRYGQISYIGGGFGTGIHNTLEAAVYGIPVIFGPKYQKFKEAVSLIKNKGAFSINNANELNQLLDALLNDETTRNIAGRKAGEYVTSQLGATETIIKHLGVIQ